MRRVTMSEKKRITVAKILESEESIFLTSSGRVIGFIHPDKAAVAAYREELSRIREGKRKVARTKGARRPT